jgi:hypothetical protein
MVQTLLYRLFEIGKHFLNSLWNLSDIQIFSENIKHAFLSNF